VNYLSESENTGRVIIKPNAITPRTYVTINDSLIVDNKLVKSLTINNVPEGRHIIHYVSYLDSYNDKLDVLMPVMMHNEKDVTKLVAVPPLSAGFWVYTAAFMLLPLLILAL
jgi:hypothetical protein